MSGPLFTSSKGSAAVLLRSWPLLPVPDAQGALHWPGVAELVRQSIEVILRTGPGEQLMRERFGAGLPAMLGEPNTVSTRAAIARAISTALMQHEPRIRIVELSVNETDDPRRVEILLAYRIQPSGEPGRIRAALDLGGPA